MPNQNVSTKVKRSLDRVLVPALAVKVKAALVNSVALTDYEKRILAHQVGDLETANAVAALLATPAALSATGANYAKVVKGLAVFLGSDDDARNFLANAG